MQNERFLHDDGEWLESMANYTKIQIGGLGNNNNWPVFQGSVSCVQLYNVAMNDAEILIKRDCPDVPQSSKSERCPEGFIVYVDKCIKVSELIHIIWINPYQIVKLEIINAQYIF